MTHWGQSWDRMDDQQTQFYVAEPMWKHKYVGFGGI